MVLQGRVAVKCSMPGCRLRAHMHVQPCPPALAAMHAAEAQLSASKAELALERDTYAAERQRTSHEHAAALQAKVMGGTPPYSPSPTLQRNLGFHCLAGALISWCASWLLFQARAVSTAASLAFGVALGGYLGCNCITKCMLWTRQPHTAWQPTDPMCVFAGHCYRRATR